MGKLAFVFSGQGAQYPGMALSFYEKLSAVRELFGGAETIRPGITELCFGGSAEELKKTVNTQPCLYLAALSGAIALRESGIEAEGVAGFSLGEIPALAYAGVFPYLEGFKLVCRRAELMQDASEKHPASMAAVLRLSHECVEELCRRNGEVYPVNYNCEGQLVVAGEEEALERFKSSVQEAGGRLMRLAVGGGFHSRFMDEAAESFSAYLETVELRQPRIAVYSNYSSEPYGSDIRGTLGRQINNPVRWDSLIRNMAAEGYSEFVELGAGSVLQKLIARILPDSSSNAVDNYEALVQLKGAIDA